MSNNSHVAVPMPSAGWPHPRVILERIGFPYATVSELATLWVDDFDG